MFGFLGRLFGSDKATSQVITHAASALDKLVYTSEEKAEDNARDTSEARVMVMEWIKNTQGQNLARRALALMIASVWLLQYVSAQVISIAAIWVETVATADKLKESTAIISANAESMNGAMMLLLSFYFAAPHMKSIVGVAMQKFGKPVQKP